jgi:hypothetical protein
MAKLHGIVSASVSGKSGGVVFAKGMKGETIMRPYQPKVKNPRTARQIAARNRLSVLSAVAAGLAEAIKIGYAKAVQGMGMYARNAWIRDYYKQYTVIANDGADVSEIDLGSLGLSRKSGIGVSPLVTLSYSSQTSKITARVTNSNDVEVNTEIEQLGIVLVIAATTGESIPTNCTIIQSTDMEGIEIPASLSGLPCFAFFKKVPVTGTQISTTTTPWKYPSDTSATGYAGLVPSAQ